MLKRLAVLFVLIIPVMIFLIARTRYGSTAAEKYCRKTAQACLALIVISIPVSIFAVHVITSSEPGVTFSQALTRIWLFWAVPLAGFILAKIGEYAARK